MLLALFLQTACTPSLYGVPQEDWQRLSEAQRTETIRGYNEREALRAQAALREREAALLRVQAEETTRLARVAAIHRGEAGQAGDLIRVTLQGGEARFGGKHRSFEAQALTLANGERRDIELASNDHKYFTYRATLALRYEDGVLSVDGGGAIRPQRLVIEPEWKAGKRYALNTPGPMELRNVQVTVEILPLRRGGPWGH